MRLPPGWMWSGGHLPDHDISPRNISDYDWLVENLFLIGSEKQPWQIDVGFYPGRNPNGSFAIRLVWQDVWEHPVQEFSSRNFTDIRAKINDLIRYADAHPSGVPLWE